MKLVFCSLRLNKKITRRKVSNTIPTDAQNAEGRCVICLLRLETAYMEVIVSSCIPIMELMVLQLQKNRHINGSRDTRADLSKQEDAQKELIASSYMLQLRIMPIQKNKRSVDSVTKLSRCVLFQILSMQTMMCLFDDLCSLSCGGVDFPSFHFGPSLSLSSFA